MISIIILFQTFWITHPGKRFRKTQTNVRSSLTADPQLSQQCPLRARSGRSLISTMLISNDIK